MKAIILMGVCGSGKTTIGLFTLIFNSFLNSGREIENRLGYEFVDGDDLHSNETKLLLSQGVSLTDRDRFPWLQRCKVVIEDRLEQKKGIVLACSCLKKIYRDIFRENMNQVCEMIQRIPFDSHYYL